MSKGNEYVEECFTVKHIYFGIENDVVNENEYIV